jgi:hypothetical protein
MPAAQQRVDSSEVVTTRRRRALPVVQPERERLTKADHAALAGRPRYRAECLEGPRPCPWVSCRHHLMLDVDPTSGRVHMNFPSLEEMARRRLPTCSLDVAETGGVGLAATGANIGVGLERARQIEVHGLKRMHERIADPLHGFEGRRAPQRVKPRALVQLYLLPRRYLVVRAGGTSTSRTYARLPTRRAAALVKRWQQLALPIVAAALPASP